MNPVYRHLRILLWGFALWNAIWGIETAAAGAVRMPLTLDYPLLRTLVASAAFPGAGDTAVLINENGGCTRLVLSNPLFSTSGGLLRFRSHISIQGGTFIGGSCMLPVQWEGYLVLFQSPVIDPQTWVLSFRTEDSKLYENDGQPAQIAGILWDLIKSWVYEYLDGIRVDLAPPVGDLKAFLLPLFEGENPEIARQMVGSLRYGNVHVTPEAIVVDLMVEAPSGSAAPRKAPGSVEAPLSEQELSRFTQLWESWDVLLVQMLTSLSRTRLSEEERRVLLDILLDTRYQFSAELTRPRPERDFVRTQFIEAWNRISPVFRNHLADTPRQTALGYLSFFTASDALKALDSISPILGIEISRDGLIRMARWISGSPDAPVEYLPDVNTDLRRLVGFEAPPEPVPEAGGFDEAPPPPAPPEDTVLPKDPEAGILRLFFPSVWAAQPPPLDEINQWVVPETETGIGDYIDRVRSVLVRSTEPVLSKGKIPSIHFDAFKRFIPAMAWQESCFRQFVPNRGKISYLLSVNGTSVGLMQINERVWRGVFDLRRLRWDIAYNAEAGCQIAALYLEKYVLANWKSKPPPEEPVLSQAVYAMYSGGPGQFDKFFKRLQSGKLLSSDMLFLEKLQWVANEQWEKLNFCLGNN